MGNSVPYVNLNIPQTEVFIRARSYTVNCRPRVQQRKFHMQTWLYCIFMKSKIHHQQIQVLLGMIKMDERNGYKDKDEWHERRDSE